MCGRYNFSTDSTDEKLAAIISVMERRYPGEYKTGEIFPGDTAPAVIARGGKIVPIPAVFGFQGYRDGKLIINARGETAAEKKMFSESLKERRIILPAPGFYEWDTSRTKYLSRQTHVPFCISAAFKPWKTAGTGSLSLRGRQTNQ